MGVKYYLDKTHLKFIKLSARKIQILQWFIFLKWEKTFTIALSYFIMKCYIAKTISRNLVIKWFVECE